MYSLRDLLTPADRQRATALLHSQGLLMPEHTESGVGLYHGDALVATGFLGGGRLMGLCVAKEYRGEGLALTVVDHLLKEALAAGCGHVFIFTKGEEAQTFAAAGFSLLVRTEDEGREGEEKGQPDVALLEWGTPHLENWLQEVREEAEHAPLAETLPVGRLPVGAVVVNANPFTRGHAYLLEQAAQVCSRLYVFVLCEDVSVFPFARRLELVRQGVARVPQAVVLSGGPYIISRHIFPSYFTGQQGLAKAHTTLDATLFAKRIAPALNITARFVGSEPLSPVTALYNAALHRILPAHGVTVYELPRLEEDGRPISASRVRELLAAGKLEQACALTAPCTAAFLRSAQGAGVVRELQTAEVAKAAARLQNTERNICPPL